MKDYSVFTKEYVNSICQEVNRSFPNYTTMREKSFIADHFEDLTDFLQNYIVYSSSLFEHLDRLGLVNRERCPYTGDIIVNSSAYWSYMNTRKVYLSHEGLSIMKKEEDERRRRILGF